MKQYIFPLVSSLCLLLGGCGSLSTPTEDVPSLTGTEDTAVVDTGSMEYFLRKRTKDELRYYDFDEYGFRLWYPKEYEVEKAEKDSTPYHNPRDNQYYLNVLDEIYVEGEVQIGLSRIYIFSTDSINKHYEMSKQEDFHLNPYYFSIDKFYKDKNQLGLGQLTNLSETLNKKHINNTPYLTTTFLPYFDIITRKFTTYYKEYRVEILINEYFGDRELYREKTSEENLSQTFSSFEYIADKLFENFHIEEIPTS